jgi:hypothetical protein
MAQQITNNLSWNSLPTKILVNAETGQAEVFLIGKGTLGTDLKIAEVGADNKWVPLNALQFTQEYNKANGTKLTSAQAQDILLTDGVTTYNNERAAIINKNSPPNTKTFLATKQNFVPGVIDPKTNIKAGQTAPTVAQTTAQPGANSNPNVGAASTSTSTSGISTAAQNISNINIGNRQNNYDKTFLAYPEDRMGGNGGDFIKFEILNYQKSGLINRNTLQLGSQALPGMEYRDTGKPLTTICLPIQSGISEGMSVDWGGGELNPVTGAFANLAFQTMAKADASANPFEGMYQGFTQSGAELGRFLKNANNSGEAKAFFVNYFTEQAVKTQGLLSRTLGAAVNNNLELLFNGPMLRNFSFNFKLTPRNPTESQTIRTMIRYFKMSMAPSLSTAQLFLLAPNVFKISYIYTGKGELSENHPFLNRIKVAALRDISVNYTPDGNYMTYQGGSMTQYDISLSFGEIDPIYENDYLLNEGLTGTGW